MNRVCRVIGIVYFLIALFFLYHQEVLAQETTGAVEELCPPYTVRILGNSEVKQGVSYRFSAQSEIPLGDVRSLEYEVWQGSGLLATYTTSSFTQLFDALTPYTIKTIIRTQDDCTYSVSQDVAVYDRIITYVGRGSDEFRLVQNSLQQTGVLLKEIRIAESQAFNDEAFLQNIVDSLSLVQHADALFLDADILSQFLTVLPRIQRLIDIDFSAVDVYVLSKINQSAFRRLFATYGELVSLREITVVPAQYFGSVLNALLLEKDPSLIQGLKVYSTDLGASKKIAFMSYVLDLLLYEGLPLGFLIMLLLLPILVIVITFLRQVVGINVYGVFNPILAAFSLHFLGILPTIFFLLISLLTALLVTIITKRIHLLYSAKISLVMIVYTLLLFAGLSLLEKYSLSVFSDQQFTNTYIIFPLSFLIVVGYAVFKEIFSLSRRSALIQLFQFAGTCFLLYMLIRWTWLQNALLGYPDLIFIALIGVILLGRYTGLQMTEYIRFMPLIRWLSSHEEEE